MTHKTVLDAIDRMNNLVTERLTNTLRTARVYVPPLNVEGSNSRSKRIFCEDKRLSIPNVGWETKVMLYDQNELRTLTAIERRYLIDFCAMFVSFDSMLGEIKTGTQKGTVVTYKDLRGRGAAMEDHLHPSKFDKNNFPKNGQISLAKLMNASGA